MRRGCVLDPEIRLAVDRAKVAPHWIISYRQGSRQDVEVTRKLSPALVIKMERVLDLSKIFFVNGG